MTKKIYAINPGRRRRKRNGVRKALSPLQKLFFGTKRQRAAVKANRGRRKLNPSRRKGKKYSKMMIKKLTGRKAPKFRGHSKLGNPRRRRRNVGSIVSVLPGQANPGRRRRRRKANRGKKVVIINKGAKMARRRKRTRSVARRVTRRRRRNPVYRGRIKRGMYKYSSNPGRRRRRARVSYRRRRNPGIRRRHYRRNPGMLSGTAGRVVGVVGGLAVTRILTGFLPAQLQTGILGYLAVGAVAMLQGKMIGKVAKSPGLASDMTIGGFAYLAAKILNDFIPSIGGYTGISGMGLIGGSSFYTPQVNQNGSMGSFVAPSAVTGAIGAATMAASRAGVGTLRRTGRLM